MSSTYFDGSKSLLQTLKLENEGKIPKSSVYRYADENMGKEMVEYHVDAC